MTATVTERAPVVVALDGHGWSVATVGGKAAALDRLVALGAPVPPAEAVTVAAYRAVAATPAVATLLERLAACDVPPDDVDAAFLDAALPDTVERELLALARRELALAPSGRVVARSSATLEDTGSASYAGQYRSVLGLAEPAEVLRAVRLVWASLWYPAPRRYRQLHGVDPATAEMAVIVMPQVEAQRAGVMFTADPGGDPAVARVEVVDGLADRLVSGEATPTVHLLGAEPVPGTPPELVELVAIGRHLERGFGHPLDIEWTWDGHRVQIVQARPITVAAAGDPLDTPLDPAATYTTAGVAEALPGVLPPLVWTVAGRAQDEAFRALFDVAGGRLDELGDAGLVARRHGRAVVDLTRVERACATMRGVSVADLEREYFDVAAPPTRDTPDDEASARGRRRRRRRRDHSRDLRVAIAAHRAVTSAAVVVEATDLVLDADVPLGLLDDRSLLAYHDRLVDLLARAMADETIVAASAAASFARLDGLLGAWFDRPEAAALARRLTAGATAVSGLNGVPLDDPDVLRRAGSRAVPGGPTWAEVGDAGDVLATLAARATAAPGDAVRRDVEATLRARPGWSTTRVLTGQVVDLRVHLLRRTTADARAALARRELAKAATLRLGGEVRRAALALGHRLAASGALERPGDVELLASTELASAIDGRPPPPVDLGRRRRHLAAHASAMLPVRFTGDDIGVEHEGGTGDVLRGWAASSGRASGRPRVVGDPVHDTFVDGDVLVATSTDASWVPLIARAAAIVVERGGPLSHAAICARELGVPAVVNVPGVVERLGGADAADASVGVVLDVDGDAGTVTLRHPASGPRAPALVRALGEVDEPVLPVFVPAIMSIGLIGSVATLAIDAARSVARSGGSRRRTAALARSTAALTVSGPDHADRSPPGLRHRTTYATLALVLTALATYLVIGQTANYLRPGGYSADIAWLWAVTMLLSAAFLGLAVACAVVAVRYHALAPTVRALVVSTPLGAPPRATRPERRR